MKKGLLLCLVGSVMMANSAWAQDGTQTAEQAVIAGETQWNKAQQINKPELIAPLLADNFLHVSSDGLSTKEQHLAALKSITWSSSNIVNLKVTVYGNTAIATAEFKGKGTDTSGKTFNDSLKYTDTWVKMPNGKWQCLVSTDN